jgi:hypothetical protein
MKKTALVIAVLGWCHVVPLLKIKPQLRRR